MRWPKRKINCIIKISAKAGIQGKKGKAVNKKGKNMGSENMGSSLEI
jgi:hypothetical protein